MTELSEALASPWIIVGLAGQAAFTLRFVVQWIASECQRKSVVPISFWYLSLVGAALLLTYAIARRDPVFILGQSVGSFIYFRNLILISRARTLLPVDTTQTEKALSEVCDEAIEK